MHFLQAPLVQGIHNISLLYFIWGILFHKNTTLFWTHIICNFHFVIFTSGSTPFTLSTSSRKAEMWPKPTRTPFSFFDEMWNRIKFNHVVIQNTITTHTRACVIIFPRRSINNAIHIMTLLSVSNRGWTVLSNSKTKLFFPFKAQDKPRRGAAAEASMISCVW